MGLSSLVIYHYSTSHDIMVKITSVFFHLYLAYSAFQMNEPHRHNKNQNLVGTLHATSLQWFTDFSGTVMKTAVNNLLWNEYPARQKISGTGKMPIPQLCQFTSNIRSAGFGE